MERSEPDPNDAPRMADEPAHAKGPPERDYLWLRSVVESSSEIITVVDPDGTLRYASPAFKHVLGYDPKEEVGTMNVLDHVHLDDLPHVLQETEEAISEGGIVSNRAEYRFRHADGSWRWIESVGTYLLDDPVVGGVVVNSRDVTERKQAEEALRRSEEEIFSILESITDGFFALDREWRFTYANSQAEVLLNRSREDLVGERIWEDPTFYPEYRRAVAEGKTVTFEGYYPPLERWYSVRAYPSESGLSVYFHDVTQRKFAEERIRFQAQLLESVGQAVIATDLEGRVTYWNRCAEQLYGWSAEEVMGRPIDEFGVSEELQGKAAEIMNDLRAGKSWSGEFTVLRKDGTSIPVLVTDTPVYDERGNLAGIIGVSRDITDRKEAYERLAESERRFSTVVSNARAYVYRCLPEPARPHEFASDYASELTGYPPEELVEGGEVRFADLIVEEDRDRVSAEIQQAIAEGRSFELGYSIRRKDGVLRHVEEYGQPVYGDDGRAEAIEGLIYDITERKEAEEALEEAKERYRMLVESVPAVTYTDRAVGSYPDIAIYISPQIEAMVGYSVEEWLDPKRDLWKERLHPEDKMWVLAADERSKATGEPFSEEYRLIAKDGSIVWVRDEAVLLRDKSGEPWVWQGVLLDVTGRKEVEKALKESEERFRRLADSAFEGILLSEEGKILEANRALIDILGYELPEMVGRAVFEFVAPEYHELVRHNISSGIEEPYEIVGVRKDGTFLDLEVRGRAFSYRGRTVRVTAVRDITERKALERRLRHHALHDAMTNLPNRYLFMDRLGHALERTWRKRGSKAAVLFMDLDDFKAINDSLGHEVGDLLLVVVAERLRHCLRPEDTLARFGGDEFTVLLEDIEGSGEAVRVAQRITDTFGRPFVLGDRELFVRPSIGIALGDARTKTAEVLLRDADTAMYRAKDEAADYRVFDPAMYERAIRQLELENEFRRAIERKEFVVHYQPTVNLQTGELWGLEALVRWDHPQRGLLDPDEFMPMAEESDLVVPMGKMVLEEACRRAVEWQREFPHTLPLLMSVNLSGRQLRRPDLHEVIEQVLEESGLSASSLGLDITETVYISALDANAAALDRLREIGVRISLDDFGSGYSSLSYLKRLPANILKIDELFIRDLGAEVEDTAIVRSIIDLAHTLGMEVVAEGVEIEEQVTLLKEMGCDFAQGHFFSEPLPTEEVAGFLERRR